MNYAVLLAGGVGNRMQTGGIPKQYVAVNEKPVIIYTLEQIERCPSIGQIVIVAADEWQEQISQWSAQYHITKHRAFALPGAARQLSVLNGLEVCMQDNPGEEAVVLIHEAVRPLVSVELLDACVAAAKQYGGCMPVLPMKDTVYESRDGACISGLPNRTVLFAGQSPEAFHLTEYVKINRSCAWEELKSYPGSSQLAHRYGLPVHLIPGEETNFKLTTPDDMKRFCEICTQSAL